ncbi:hypothetical protein [Nocardioides marmoraquaticus]
MPRPPARRRWTDRIPTPLLTHPLELALGLLLVVNGARGLIGDVTPSLTELPALMRLAYLAISSFGGVVLVGGIIAASRRPAITRTADAPIPAGVAVERAALFVVAASYAGLALVVIFNNPGRGTGYALVLAVIAAACWLRTVAIRITTHKVLAVQAAARRDRE